MSSVCLYTHVKCPNRIHFVWKTTLLVLCCHVFRFLFVLPVPLGRPHLDMSVVSNYLSFQHGEWHTSNSHYFILLKQFIHVGLGHIDQALPVFSVSHAVSDGSEWVDGNDKTSLTIPGWSPSVKGGELSHHPLWDQQFAVLVEMLQISLFLYFSAYSFCFLLSSSFSLS